MRNVRDATAPDAVVSLGQPAADDDVLHTPADQLPSASRRRCSSRARRHASGWRRNEGIGVEVVDGFSVIERPFQNLRRRLIARYLLFSLKQSKSASNSGHNHQDRDGDLDSRRVA